MADTNGSFIVPDWPAPSGVFAVSTTRRGGYSEGSWRDFNLAQHVGDDAEVVQANRALLQHRLPGTPELRWLRQVHGTGILRRVDKAVPGATADACWTSCRGVTCAVLTADCLPVLLCSVGGDRVAAVHAGWRGLAAGVLEKTIAAMGGRGEELMAWLGPAIGRPAFEVGPEVRTAFLGSAPAASEADIEACFLPASGGRAGHFFADLRALARLRLQHIGLSRIYGDDRCTFSDAENFFSYRRDGQTGRMATLVMLR